MKKLDKPIFFSKLGNILVIIIPSFTGTITFLFKDLYKTLFNIDLKWNVFICIVLVLITICIFIGKYLWNIRKFYKDYEKQYEEYNNLKQNNDALIKQYKDKQKEVKLLNNRIEQYEFVLNNILNNVSNGLCNISIPEKEFLKGLQENILRNKVYLYELKGNECDE